MDERTDPVLEWRDRTYYNVKGAAVLCPARRGLFSTTEDDCYIYKIQDMQLTLVHIRHFKKIKSFLLKASEAARIKRRTLNVQDISTEDLEESEALIDE